MISAFELNWRNKYLTSEATTLDDMIQALQAAVYELAEMRRAGVVLDLEKSDMHSDWAFLVTDDPIVAARFDFDFDLPETDEDEEEPEEEDEEELTLAQVLSVY